LNEQYLAFALGGGFVFDSLGHNKHFTCSEVNSTVRKLDAHLAVKNDENVIRFGVAVPHKLSLDFDQFELVVIHLGDDLRRPMIRELCKLFDKVNGGVFHMSPPVTNLCAA